MWQLLEEDGGGSEWDDEAIAHLMKMVKKNIYRPSSKVACCSFSFSVVPSLPPFQALILLPVSTHTEDLSSAFLLRYQVPFPRGSLC